MGKKLSTACSGLAVLLAAFPAEAAPKKTPTKPLAAAQRAENPACAGLSADYEDASKQIAMNIADGAGDNSAVRATMRETQNSNSLEKARMTLDLMKGNGCKMPTAAPGGSRYLTAALDCKLALTQQILDRSNAGIPSWNWSNMPARPAACDMTKWQPPVAAAPTATPVSTVHSLVPAETSQPEPTDAEIKMGEEAR